jgi:hypothetical protein
VKAIEQVQSMSCDLYKDERYIYLECSLAEPNERKGQVNSINNEPSFMSNPPIDHI